MEFFDNRKFSIKNKCLSIGTEANAPINFLLKMTPWLMAIFCLATAGCSNITDQQASESNQQVAILKQIRKVNEDGSYTFGYEAGDGSFKVHNFDFKDNLRNREY